MEKIDQNQTVQQTSSVNDIVDHCNGTEELKSKLSKLEEINQKEITSDKPDNELKPNKTVIKNEEVCKTEMEPDHSPSDTSIKYVRAKESDEMVKSAKKKKFKDKHVSFEMDHIDKHYER